MKQAFVTLDGQFFINQNNAKKHEDELFEKWLKTNPVLNVTALLGFLNSKTQIEFYGTQQDVAKFLIYKYWEKNYESH
jgi:hypothetical protein